jgi:hypothetical protein
MNNLFSRLLRFREEHLAALPQGVCRWTELRSKGMRDLTAFYKDLLIKSSCSKSASANCVYQVIASEAKQPLSGKEIASSLKAPRNDTYPPVFRHALSEKLTFDI